MHTGAVMALRQFLGQYLVIARPWQRALIAAGVVCGALLMIALGVAFGHLMLAAAGVLLLVATGNAFVAILRARRARARGADESQLYPEGYKLSRVKVDSEELTDVTRRLRRAQGQIGGVIRMIEDGRDCSDVVTQLAAAARALDRAGFKIIASGLCQCMLDEQAGRGQATADRAALERLFLSLA
jgi:DNA-binding FrmR family transcriptional regulator